MYQPPAISPAKPIPPSDGSVPFPTPFSGSSHRNNKDNKFGEDEMEGKSSSSLNKVLDGRINKRKNYPKIEKAMSSDGDRKDFVNAKLRRMIYPRNPVLILGDLALKLNKEERYRFMDPVEEVIDDQKLKLYPCEVDFNGGTFSGLAPDSEISKSLAAESAIQAYTVNAVNGEAPNPNTLDPLDNAPWAALASLGLFKLFNDWENRGFSLPLNAVPGQMKQQQSMQGKSVESSCKDQGNFTMRPCKNIPENPTSKHPVSVLNEMYPGTPFISSIHPNQPGLFQMSVTINGKNFVGTGRNKKDAKKFCAMAALKELMN